MLALQVNEFHFHKTFDLFMSLAYFPVCCNKPYVNLLPRLRATPAAPWTCRLASSRSRTPSAPFLANPEGVRQELQHRSGRVGTKDPCVHSNSTRVQLNFTRFFMREGYGVFT